MSPKAQLLIASAVQADWCYEQSNLCAALGFGGASSQAWEAFEGYFATARTLAAELIGAGC